MSLYGSNVECGLHCLIHLAGSGRAAPPSARDLAEFQGVSPTFVAKIFTRLEKAGIVASTEGIHGGFRLARPASEVTVLDVVDALEGEKPLFNCREVRARCVLYGETPPDWAVRGTCRIHAVMIEAEKRMRASLAGVTIADIADDVAAKLPRAFGEASREWFDQRSRARRARRKREPEE